MSLFVAAYVFSGIAFALDAAVLEVEYTVGTARGFDIVSDHYDGLAFVVDIGKIEALVYDSPAHFYRVVGEKVGNAFKDGMALK